MGHVTVKVAHGISLSLHSTLVAYCSVAAIAVAVGCGAVRDARADGETRTISFHHVHTKEDLTVTYKVNGRYDEEALKKINNLLRDWREQEPIKMDPELIDVLWEVHREVGAKEPISVICGYRSPDTNAMLRRRSSGVAKTSQHMLGKAVDFFIPGVALEDIQAAGLRAQRGGVGFYPSSHFVHLDTGSVRHWPRMPEAQLAKVLSKGPLDSRMASDNGGTRQVAMAQTVRKPGLLARLFGGAKDDEEDADTAAALAAPAKAAAPRATSSASASRPEKPAEKPVVVAAAEPRNIVPLPQAKPIKEESRFQVASADTRPIARAGLFTSVAPTAKPVEPEVTAEPAPAGGFGLASASSQPVRPAQAASLMARTNVMANNVSASNVSASNVSANDVINERGFWQGLPNAEPTEAVKARAPAPSARRVASADPGMTATVATASLAPWPLSNRAGKEPPPNALAYAAQPTPIAAARPAPMGAGNSRPTSDTTIVAKRGGEPPRPQGSGLPSSEGPSQGTNQGSNPGTQLVKVGDRFNDPWLRAMIVSPSAQGFMRTSLFGVPDFRNLGPFLQKPATAMAMSFAQDPYFGMTTDKFTGSAVFFMTTSSFGARTASLR